MSKQEPDHFEMVRFHIEATREAIMADRDFCWLPKESIANWIQYLAQSI